jgi:hypothetical protein
MLVINSLSILADRKSPCGWGVARQLLEDPRDWAAGAFYLAAMGQKSSVPYLIACLRHPASGLRKRGFSICGNLPAQITD